MNLKRIFKNLILIDAALFTLTLIVTFFFQSKKVEKVYETLHYFDSEILQMAIGIGALITIVFFYVSLFMLYKSYRFGKIVFTIYFILTSVFLLNAGINVSEALSTFVDYLQSATDGAILFMLYFTTITKDFIIKKKR